MSTGTIAGHEYYSSGTWGGAVRCVDCICDQYGEASFEKVATMREAYDAGRPVAEGNARIGLPAESCNECDTCARPVCRGMVCGACGFAPGCEEHDEGHHRSCPEKPGIVFAGAASDSLRCSCGNDVMGDGFYPADPETGAEVEPEPGKWNGRRYRCWSCGANYDQAEQS